MDESIFQLREQELKRLQKDSKLLSEDLTTRLDVSSVLNFVKLVLNQKTREFKKRFWWWILWRLRNQDVFSSRFFHLRNELRIFRSSPVTISSWRFRVVSTSGCLHVRTGFIQQRTVRNEGLSGKFISDCL